PDRLNAIINGDPDPLPALAEAAKGDYSEPFLRAVDFGLNVLEKDRPQSLVDWETGFDPESERAQSIRNQPRNYSLVHKAQSPWRRRLLKGAAIGAAAAVVLGVSAYFLKPVFFPPKVLLYVQGSNTIGEELMPELAKAYLQSIGAKNATLHQIGTATEKQVEA